MVTKPVDKQFLGITVALIVAGFFIFISASMGLHARGNIAFGAVVFKQIALGLVLGTCALLLASRTHYRFWKHYAPHIFGICILLMLLVFIPGMGISHGGAQRWVSILGFSFQPAEFLKVGFVMFLASWLSRSRGKIHNFSHGLMPVLVMLAIAGTLLILQPDAGTFLIIAATATAMYIAAGASIKDILILVLMGMIAFSLLVAVKPYILDRLKTFVHPSEDSLGSGYQIQQSLIAIGSGELFGRGFGQSVQKFNLLPEPIGDSIFAVAAEEFGFVGSISILALFLFFALRGLHIASKMTDVFGGLLVVGVVIMIVSQSFVNIASMLGVFPLTGMPLLFISQGGTALLVTLGAVGIVLNASRYQRQ
ncbi:stage V sporulation protein E [Candidatus Wolfebacteria bacterium]|nr:MAG: stage V sporulation protein E [Candidatus Wolfebacteria bacterium]